VWPVSRRWEQAIRHTYTPAVRATLYPPRARPFEVPVVSWSVTADRTSNTRRTCQVVLPPGVPRGLDGVTTAGAYLQLDVGIDYLDGSQELIPQGYFRLDAEQADRPGGAIQLQGYGREKAVADDAFPTPRTESNSSALDLIEQLITESVPGAIIVRRTTRDTPVPATTWDQDRWGAVDGTDTSLARALGVEVWCDGRGRFVISDVPTLADRPVWTVNAGAEGVLISASASTSTDGVYNVIAVSGDATDGTTPIGPIIVQDQDPTSPTWVGGPFGRRVRRYSSPLITTPGQAGDAGRSLLGNSIGLTRQLSFTALQNPALEPGDVVRTDPGDGLPELHLIDRIQLSSSAPMQCDTRSTRPDDGSS
jgi:hypothetical protein